MKILLAFLTCILFVTQTSAAEIRLAVTTSFENSGLAAVLLPRIEEDIDLKVRLIVVGTGQALRLGRAGDVDAVLVHSKKAEDEFIKDGFGSHRREIMFNDFIIIGPKSDPAGLSDMTDSTSALAAIANAGASFVSRGDDSGTHKKELSLWKEAGIDPNKASGDWYLEVGAGMGSTLNTASAKNAHTLADRGSWLKFANKGELTILHQGDPRLHNQYALVPVSSARHSHVKSALVQQLEDWLASDKGQKLIADYRLSGEQLFTPNAKQ